MKEIKNIYDQRLEEWMVLDKGIDLDTVSMLECIELMKEFNKLNK